MKPIILYQPNETNFTSNGLGVLNDAASAVVTEERNSTYELVIKYPVTGKRFADIRHSSIIRCLTTPQGSYQIFRVYAISKPMNGIVTIHAEHVSYQLTYIPVNAFTAGTAAEAMVRIKSNALATCPFDFWTDKQVTAPYVQEEPSNIRARLGGVDGSILDVYGGEYEFDNYTVKLHTNRGTNRGVTLRYGKNITNIEQEENIGETYTSIVGYWKSEDEIVKTSVINSAYVNAYPYNRTMVVDFSSYFDEKPSIADLTAIATNYMTENNFGIPHVSIKISFAALWQTEEYKNIAPLERLYLCDTVSVYFEKLGISVDAKVVKTMYNALLDRYDAIELGEARADLSSRLASQSEETKQRFNEAKSELEKSIDRATALITGNMGGHVVTRLDADGKPTELLIMDTDDVETAVKVWRFNLAGWGYSSTGVDGTYRLAATQDGHIVADFIDTGTLTGNIIKAGIITDSANLNYWNMVTGDFRLAANNGSADGIKLTNGTLVINGTYITTGTLDASQANIINLNADHITTGHFSADLIRGGQLIIDNDNYSAMAIIVKHDGNDYITMNYNKGIELRSTGTSTKISSTGITIGYSSGAFDKVQLSASTSGGNLVVGNQNSDKTTISNGSVTINRGTNLALSVTGRASISTGSGTALTLSSMSSATALSVSSGKTSVQSLDVNGTADISTLSGAINATSSKIGFFGDSGSSQKTVSRLSSSATQANIITKINDLLSALNDYSLISSRY